MNRRELLLSGAGAIAATGLSSEVFAATQREISIGAIFPMTGSSAEIGVHARQAIETARELINGKFDIDLPLANSAGLPGLGGAKIKVIFADHQGDPAKGRSEAERLLTQNKVACIIGAFHSAVSATISATTERYSVPYICADSSAPSLAHNGLKYFFRPSPNDNMFSKAMFDFLDSLKKSGNAPKTIALFYEDTIFGIDSANIQRKLAGERGYKIVADVKYKSNSPSLTSEVQQLKNANADVLMPSSYTTDAITLVKTMAELGYKPKAIIAQAAGFSDATLYKTVGDKLAGVITRSAFSLDLGAKRPSILAINKMYKAKSGIDLDDNTSRQFMGLIVAADAINRAKSIAGPKIRGALVKTDIPGARTIMPWEKIQFDADGQNEFANPVLLQYVGGHFKTIFPSVDATAKAIWPMNS